MFERILVAVDGSEVAAAAVDVAARLAGQLGSEVCALHVVDDSRAYILDLAMMDNIALSHLRRAGAVALEAAWRRIPPALKPQRLLVEGDPSEMIIATARDWQADLIVVGNDSRGRLAHFLLGSTADSVIRHAPCPVVAVRSNGQFAHAQTAVASATAVHQPAAAESPGRAALRA
jgi:nucleotide-binding universal stress UspA family protein